MAKRIYTLAKELGVDSKVIVAKCQAEGLSDTVKNHMSTLSAGLEATIREWFSEAESAHTAVEETDKVDVAAAKRKASKKRKKRKTKKVEEKAAPAPVEAQAGEAQASDVLVAEEAEAAAVKEPEEAVEEEVGAEGPEIQGPVAVEPPAKPKMCWLRPKVLSSRRQRRSPGNKRKPSL